MNDPLPIPGFALCRPRGVGRAGAAVCEKLTLRPQTFVHPDDGPVVLTLTREIWTCGLPPDHPAECQAAVMLRDRDGRCVWRKEIGCECRVDRTI